MAGTGKKAAGTKNAATTVVNGYMLVSPFVNANSGFARWTFGKKDGKEYFIKEFLSPKCPRAADVSEVKYKRSKAICDDYYTGKLSLYDAINRSSTGNIVTIAEFFFYGTCFYITTEKIDTFNCSIKEISDMTDEAKMLLMKVLSSCLMSLHKNGVVHADLKPSNILVKKTRSGSLTAKLIDFDGSYLVGAQPDCEGIQGDQIYLAPETCRAMFGETVPLTQAVDVFALGILFHQYLTGELPQFPREYQYVHEALLDGAALGIDSRVPPALADILSDMLQLVPEQRPTTAQIYQKLQELAPSAVTAPKPAAEKDPEPKPAPVPAATAAPEGGSGSRLRMGTFAKKKESAAPKEPIDPALWKSGGTF